MNDFEYDERKDLFATHVQLTYTTILEHAAITLGTVPVTVAVIVGSRIQNGLDWLDCVVADRDLIGVFHWFHFDMDQALHPFLPTTV